MDNRCKVVGQVLLFKYIQYKFILNLGKVERRMVLEYRSIFSEHVSNNISLKLLLFPTDIISKILFMGVFLKEIFLSFVPLIPSLDIKCTI